jgi:TetR/AcrR family transcriptional regulator, fatty acid biosynthesis regulator
VEKLSRKEAKERTRQRLIDAILDHVRGHGLAGLTTGKVADAAGIAQSSFYVHFNDMDEALRAAAERVSNQVREIIRAARAEIDLSNTEAALRSAFGSTLHALLDERQFTELLLSHRREPGSPVGETLSKALDDARADLAADLARLGLDADFVTDVDAYADLLVGMTLSAVESLLDGRTTDREVWLRALVRTTRALLDSAIPK